MKVSIKIFLALVLIGVAMTIYFFVDIDMSQKSFYDHAVENSKNRSYRGVVVKKNYDQNDGGREKIVLASELDGLLEMDFIYEKPNLYEYIKVGDTLEKKKKSLELRILRGNQDTTFILEFKNLKKE